MSCVRKMTTLCIYNHNLHSTMFFDDTKRDKRFFCVYQVFFSSFRIVLLFLLFCCFAVFILSSCSYFVLFRFGCGLVFGVYLSIWTMEWHDSIKHSFWFQHVERTYIHNSKDNKSVAFFFSLEIIASKRFSVSLNTRWMHSFFPLPQKRNVSFVISTEKLL